MSNSLLIFLFQSFYQNLTKQRFPQQNKKTLSHSINVTFATSSNALLWHVCVIYRHNHNSWPLWRHWNWVFITGSFTRRDHEWMPGLVDDHRQLRQHDAHRLVQVHHSCQATAHTESGKITFVPSSWIEFTFVLLWQMFTLIALSNENLDWSHEKKKTDVFNIARFRCYINRRIM